MFTHTSMSRAWQELTTLTDLSFDEIRSKYGVTWLNPASPIERLLTANGYILKFTLEEAEGEITLSIVNDSIPLGRLPKKRTFKIDGSVDHPLILEHGEEPKDVKNFF